ncbi:MAG TPA: ACT domain-containing protein [Acidimicrobiia bacterium]|nr:ACT domain-containing protein [Acidimicrobiia bacterium]
MFETAIRVRLPDRPGALARVASVIAAHGVNITRFEIAAWAAGTVWDHFQLAAGSVEQLGEVVSTLRREGYKVLSLPDRWTIRDWGLDALRGLEKVASSSPETVQTEILAALTSLAHCTHGLLLSDRVESFDVGLEEAASAFDLSTIRWFGDGAAITPVVNALAKYPAEAAPGGSSSGVAMVVGGGRPGLIAAAIGRRPSFLEAEVDRVRSWLAVAGCLLQQRDRRRPSR